MTVSSSTNRVSFSGNGSTTAFAYSFKIFADSDLTVILRAADGTETTQTITTHYTVSGAGSSSGGNVTFGSAPASGVTVVILRQQPLTQGLDLVANDPFPSASIEDSLDKLTFMVQQHDEELGRAIKASKTNTISGSEFTISSTNRANKVFAFDSSGDLSVTQELGTYRGDFAASTAYVVRDLIKDTSTNNIFLVNEAHTSSGSEPLTSNTNSAKYTLIVDASSATTSQTAAASSASAASTSATAAASSATGAASSATAAASSATTATNAQAAAASSQVLAENAATSFTGQYSTGSSDPTSNLNTGDLFYNSSSNLMKVYNGSAWVNLTPTSSEQTNIDALAASAVITDMALLATSAVIEDMSILATSDIVTDMSILGTSANVTAMSNVSGSISNVNTVASNISDINSVASATSSGLAISTTNKVSFRDSDLFINSSGDGQLDIDADTELEITAPTVDLNASTSVNVSNDLKLDSDAAVLGFGADNDVTLTHVADTGLLLNSTMAIQFNDASQFINAPSATVLDINATDEIELNATLVDVNGNLDVSGTVTATGTSVFASLDISGDIDVDGTTNLDAVDVDGAVNFAADVTFADGADIITASAGTNNVRVGVNAGNSIASGGNENTVIGDEAGTALTTGDSNVAIGYNALKSEDAHSFNVAVGRKALENMNVGANGFNTAVGQFAGNALTTGVQNTFLGSNAGDALTDADYNTALGQSALTTDTLGSRTTAIGTFSLFNQNQTSAVITGNTAVGYAAGNDVTTGVSDTFVGYSCGANTTTGGFNTFLGYQAGIGSSSTAHTGNENTVVGAEAGTNIQGAANGNAILGRSAGLSLTTGSDNVFIGHDAGRDQVTTGSNLLYIARSNAAAGNDQVWIHGTSTGTCINGDNSTAWAQTSDKRIKKNITDSDAGLDKINLIKIRNFEYRTFDELDDDVKALNNGKGLSLIEKSGIKTGVIAQEIEEIFPDDVQDVGDGTKIVTPSDMNFALIKAVQELSAKNDALEARLAKLEA